MLLFSNMLYMLVRYAIPSGSMSLRFLMLTSGHVELMFLLCKLFDCHLDLCRGECYFGCLQFVCFPIYVSVCFVCFMFECVSKLFSGVCLFQMVAFWEAMIVPPDQLVRCTQDKNIHLHDETRRLPIHEHLQLHASQHKQKTQHPSHPLHKHTSTLQG